MYSLAIIPVSEFFYSLQSWNWWRVMNISWITSQFHWLDITCINSKISYTPCPMSWTFIRWFETNGESSIIRLRIESGLPWRCYDEWGKGYRIIAEKPQKKDAKKRQKQKNRQTKKIRKTAKKNDEKLQNYKTRLIHKNRQNHKKPPK